jgi:hypothetical protein
MNDPASSKIVGPAAALSTKGKGREIFWLL